MIRRELVISNRLGLHARAAVKLVQAANDHESHIILSTNRMCADAKSILGVLTLAAGKNTPIVIEAEGVDEGSAVAAIEALIEGKFGED